MGTKKRIHFIVPADVMADNEAAMQHAIRSIISNLGLEIMSGDYHIKTLKPRPHDPTDGGGR